MKQLKLFALVLLALVVLACGEVPTPPAPGTDATTPAVPKSWPAEAQPLVQLVQADLIARTQVVTATVVSVEAVEWPDGCLGASMEDEVCIMVITPGYRIVMQAGDQQYEYRTDTRNNFRRYPAEPTWSEEAQPLVQLIQADLISRTQVVTATVVSVEAVEWPDGCLGLATEDEACIMMITPGYRIVMQAGDQQYEYRTDTRSNFRRDPAEPTWSDEAQGVAEQALADLISRTLAPTATIVSVDEVQWPDGCLGCGREDEMCTQAIVPGYRVVLRTAGQQYEYRTDTSGRVMRRCPPETALGEEVQDLVDRARADLAGRLQIEQDQIKVVSTEQVMWRDSSIGCPKPGGNYLTVIVPGFKITLEAEGQMYAYHAGDKGEVFLCERTP